MKKAKIISLFIFLSSIFIGNNLLSANQANETDGKNFPIIQEEKLESWPTNISWFDEKFTQPVVFKGLAKDWQVMGLTYDHLADKFSDNKFIFGIDEEEEPKYAKCFPDSEEDEIDGFFGDKPEGWPLSFSDFWNRVKKGDIKRFYGETILNKPNAEVDYLPYNLSAYFSKIFESDNMPAMLKKATKTTLFVSGPGSVRLTHSHESVLLVQIEGKKMMTFAAPDQASYLYVKYCKHGTDYKENGKSCVSPVNIRNPDLKKFPEFANAHLTQVLLEPGDVIFIPEGWFHEVRALDNSISLSFFYKT